LDDEVNVARTHMRGAHAPCSEGRQVKERSEDAFTLNCRQEADGMCQFSGGESV
jgi:hypothetical protein